MAGLRFTELQTRPMEFLGFHQCDLDEFQQLVPPFEDAFHARTAAWRMDGKPRTARRFTVYKNCPLPTPEDRVLFILVYLQNLCPPGGARALIRDGPGQSQSVDSRARRCWPRCAPRRCPGPILTALAQRLGVSEAAAVSVLLAKPPPSAPVAGPASPLLPMTAPNGASSAPKTLLHRRTAIAGRKRPHAPERPARQCLLVILFLSDTHGGVSLDLRIAEATPYH